MEHSSPNDELAEVLQFAQQVQEILLLARTQSEKVAQFTSQVSELSRSVGEMYLKASIDQGSLGTAVHGAIVALGVQVVGGVVSSLVESWGRFKTERALHQVLMTKQEIASAKLGYLEKMLPRAQKLLTKLGSALESEARRTVDPAQLSRLQEGLGQLGSLFIHYDQINRTVVCSLFLIDEFRAWQAGYHASGSPMPSAFGMWAASVLPMRTGALPCPEDGRVTLGLVFLSLQPSMVELHRDDRAFQGALQQVARRWSMVPWFGDAKPARTYLRACFGQSASVQRLRRRRLVHRVVLAGALAGIGASAVWGPSYLRGARVESALHDSDPCAARRISEVDLSTADEKLRDRYSARMDECQREEQKEAKAAACGVVAREVAGGTFESARADAGLTPAQQALLVRISTKKLSQDDLLSRPADLPCGSTKHADQLWEELVGAAAGSNLWEQVPRVSVELGAALASRTPALKPEVEAKFQESLEKLARSVIAPGKRPTDPAYARAMAACQLERDLKISSGIWCKALLARDAKTK